MLLLGLTGGIGMGKSTAAALLQRLGVAVVDTDEIARELVAPGQPALAEIQAAFGAEVLRPDGTLDRGRMARLAFGDEDGRRRLEAILHPRIREAWANRVGDWRSGGVKCGVVVIPLLFETAAESRFDAVICVACSAETQRRRLRERGWSEEHVDQRLAAQLPIELKIRKSGYLIWTETPVEVQEDQWKIVLRTLLPG
ncbi:MAG: dephospho-CoA kinase [Limisphaerales bacterium]